METNELLTIDELCQILHIGKNTAMNLINEGRIKAIKPGRKWIIPLTALNDYIKHEIDHK